MNIQGTNSLKDL